MTSTTETARKTLSEFKTHTSELRGHKMVSRISVGTRGMGGKVHLVFSQYYTEVPEDSQAKVGGRASSYAPCNGNGQHVASPVEGWDTDKITCSKCLKYVVQGEGA